MRLEKGGELGGGRGMGGGRGWGKLAFHKRSSCIRQKENCTLRLDNSQNEKQKIVEANGRTENVNAKRHSMSVFDRVFFRPAFVVLVLFC